MVTRTREFGGVQPSVLIGTVAAMMIGGAILFFVNREPAAAAAQETAIKAAPRAQVERPEAADPAAVPRVAEDADKIMQGDLIKFRDEAGNVRYRVREPFKGTSPDGRDTYWRLEAYGGPTLNKMKMDKEKFGRKNQPKLSPPRFKFEGGKLVKTGK